MQHYEAIRDLIDRVRRRWRTLQAFEAVLRAAVAAIVVGGIALTAALPRVCWRRSASSPWC